MKEYHPPTAARFDVLTRGERIRRRSYRMVFTCLGRGAERLQFQDKNGRVGWINFKDGAFERIVGGEK